MSEQNWHCWEMLLSSFSHSATFHRDMLSPFMCGSWVSSLSPPPPRCDAGKVYVITGAQGGASECHSTSPRCSPLTQVARPCSQAGHMRSCPAWDEAEPQINCLICCCRDDTRQELRDQAYPYTKKVKQTKKNHRPTDSATSTQLELSFVFLFSLNHSTQWPWNHCLYIPFSYFNSLTLCFLTYFSSFTIHKRALKA